MNFNMSTLRKIADFAQKAFKFYQSTQQDSAQETRKPSQSRSGSQRRTASSSPATTDTYPGDFQGSVNFAYSPENDGDPDPGEIVWAWVPFEEDYSQGKNRPVLIIGKNGSYFLTLMLTSKDHNNSHHHDSRYLDIGSGSWDKSGRESEIKLDRVIQIAEHKIRREGSTVDSATFNRIQQAFENHNRG